jgi:hypothetical protein
MVLASVLLAGALRPAPVRAATITALGWPESRKGIPDGSEVQLGEFFDEGSAQIPCQASTSATVAFNGLSTDSISAEEPPTWDECGSLAVTNGLTAVTLNEQEIRATAEPEITLDEPGGCVYGLAQVEGHQDEAGFALYTVVGSAKRKSGTSCAEALEVKGGLGVYGPQAGGFGRAPWVEISEQEKEALEKAPHEREEREAAEKQQHEREEREARERVAKQQHEREEKEQLEKHAGGGVSAEVQAVIAKFSPLFKTRAALTGRALGLLIGFPRISGLPSNSTVVIRCRAGCQYRFDVVRHPKRGIATVTLKRELLLRATTVIEIAVTQPGRIGRFVDYAFRRSAGRVVPYAATRGCVNTSGKHEVCT